MAEMERCTGIIFWLTKSLFKNKVYSKNRTVFSEQTNISYDKNNKTCHSDKCSM